VLEEVMAVKWLAIKWLGFIFILGSVLFLTFHYLPKEKDTHTLNSHHISPSMRWINMPYGDEIQVDPRFHHYPKIYIDASGNMKEDDVSL